MVNYWAIAVVNYWVDEHSAVRAIMERKYETRARTLARRRETVDRVREAAQALGWVLTADERTMLAGVLG